MTETLLATKLYLPSLPTRILHRQSLLDLLASGLSVEKRLILLCAPAGYGKTTLICEWLQSASNVCWISLEKSDNDTRRFISYLIASLQKTVPQIGEVAHQLLETPQLPPLPAILSSVLNDLASVDAQCIVVLEDYHVIHTNAIHEGITFLLDHLPSHKHIVITTRSDPALPLPRYRSREQMVEIRADDLRFSAEEVSSYMKEIAEIPLSESETTILEGRTEGWVAGLQMAALSLRSKADKEQFIRSLGGTHRYILDYLLEEVLNNQPEAVQRFLMETAILDRLCAPLCDAVTGLGEEVTREILQRLERDNLFIISLDEERYWYRYHHLFQDLLNLRLKQSLPEKIKASHRSAAHWYQSHGWISEAVQHYIDGADFERAADLVEQHTVQLFAQGKLDQLVNWIKKLPADLSVRRPWLSIYQAWALAFSGKNPEAESLIQVVIQSLEGNELSAEARKKLWAEIYGIRALLSITSGNLQVALDLEHVLSEEIDPDSLFARNVILWSLGYAWRMQGKLREAIVAFREVLAIGRQLNNIWVMSTGYADLGMVLRLSGRLTEAEEIYRESLEMLHQAGAGGLGYIGRSKSFLANLLCECNRLDEAWKLTTESIDHSQLWKNPNHLAHAYWTQARILYAKGDTTAAEHALNKAGDIAAQPGVVPNLHAVVDTFRVRLSLEQGRLSEADRWAEEHPISEKTLEQNIEVFDLQALIHARVLIAQEKPSAAWKLLEKLETDARTDGRVNTLVETLVLKALAAPKRAAALEVLESALELGIPEGYRRTFLDEGDRLMQLLESLRGRSTFVEPLLGPSRGKPKLETLLTERELDILRGMAEGLSNKEIGQKLFISTGTVKAHSATIYRKLEVANRTEAIARAKDLGLL
ncbi:MAG TPA: LuxR C-terminal-related transcriptional regulator [Anaerolineales bacterium]|nr:LuxR C-terminal-related transcriptional regulator [Anaerolineales bacterium]